MPTSSGFDLKNSAINALRFLSADAVQEANSGHPGLPMGAAAMAYTVWTRHLRFNPKNPKWADRDRFILSGGHGSMLLYSLLYLTGYDLPMEEIIKFRQWGSLTPGHPEYGLTPGVEATTGPLGQGFGNGVGMAMAAEHLAAIFNKPTNKIIDHHVYAIVTDGDLMEGVASEAASFAGYLQLGKLIYLYDDNRITIDGSTDISFTEDRLSRFDSYGWHTQYVEDGNEVETIDKAIHAAKSSPKPSLIAVRTNIGFGLPTRQDSPKAHGEPPGVEELAGAKRNLNWPISPSYYIPEDVLDFYRQFIGRGQKLEADWQVQFENYCQEYPDLGKELKRRLENELPHDWYKSTPAFPPDEKGMATRVSSGLVLNSLAKAIPELLGGSADLTPSNKTWIDGSPSFQKDSYKGRNIHFGVREHAMGACVNGMALHGGLIPYGGTFLVFSDYLRPSIRVSALSGYPSIWIFTHDSIGLGEDGPTHQPVEQLTALRAIPDLVVIRPADANEVSEAWRIAIERRQAPTTLILTRQNVPTLDRAVLSSAEGLSKGAYTLTDLGDGKPDIILMASGSEVSLILKAGNRLSDEGINVRIVSFPSWELFTMQSKEYRESILPTGIKARLSVEAGISMGWEKWIGDQGVVISIERFGASAPYKRIYEEFGLTVDNIILKAKTIL